MFIGLEAHRIEAGGQRPTVLDAARPPAARASIDRGHDQDGDGLPDELESILGSEMLFRDSDGDTFPDGLEWIGRSDPLDPLDHPLLRPAMRCFAYELNGQIKVFLGLFPADLDVLDSFSAFLGNESIKGTSGNELIGIVNITGILATAVRSVTAQPLLGTTLAGFTLDIPITTLDQYSPLCVGISASVAGVTLVDEVTLVKRGGRRMSLASETAGTSGGGGTGVGFVMALLPLDPYGGPGAGGGGSEDPEYCQANLSDGDPTGLGGIQFLVESANCVPDGLLYCVGQDCAALEGETFVMIDYGFLQAQAQ
jgi:hypothetical protein